PPTYGTAGTETLRCGEPRRRRLRRQHSRRRVGGGDLTEPSRRLPADTTEHQIVSPIPVHIHRLRRHIPTVRRHTPVLGRGEPVTQRQVNPPARTRIVPALAPVGDVVAAIAVPVASEQAGTGDETGVITPI